MKLLTAAQMRKAELYAIETMRIPSLLLMENAAAQTVKHIVKVFEDNKTIARSAVVICGTGNNGGDGFAVARLLFVKGIAVHVFLVGEASSVRGDALINMEAVKGMSLPLEIIPPDIPADDTGAISALLRQIDSAGVIVDALFGTGFHGRAAGAAAQVIAAVNNCGVDNHRNTQIVSVDIPSGVEADTGYAEGIAITADITVTFGRAKPGLYLYPGTEYAGRVFTEDISIPQEVFAAVCDKQSIEVLEEKDIRLMLPKRPARSNKGSFGYVCVLAGCREMPGAAVLCCQAAYRAGAGYVNACAVSDAARAIQAALPEAVTTVLPDENGSFFPGSLDVLEKALQRADVVAIGPGISRSAAAGLFVRELLPRLKVPAVIDADALFAVKDDPGIFRRMSIPCVITPHPGEMSALTGLTIKEITSSLMDTAREFSRRHNVITLLKDARTVIAAPDGRTVLNLTGTPALAKAGTGDVLTGVLAAFIAQGIQAFEAASLASYIHGQAGRLAACEYSEYGVLAGDTAKFIAASINLTASCQKSKNLVK